MGCRAVSSRSAGIVVSVARLSMPRRDGEILYAQSQPDAPVNGEFLCSKGRFGWDFVSHPDRLTQPMIRRDVAYEIGLTDVPWQLPETLTIVCKETED